jgi:hypothetical protein
VDFLSKRHPAKSAYENPWRAKEEDEEYQRPKSGVCRKYRKMRLTACRCKVLGDAWKWAHRHTENWMSGLVTVKYRSDPIMLRYSFRSTCSPSSSASRAVVVLIGVSMVLGPPSLTSSQCPWCTLLSAQMFLPLTTWSGGRGRTTTHPSCSSQIPCSCLLQTLQPKS